ncbi:hypothetical protein HN843_05795 [bacterium]|jgi:hypothetical protein|nr:hypothetical protein [bacterium]
MLKFSRKTLLKLAGIMWICVGGLLLTRAVGWLRFGSPEQAILSVSAGILLGIILYRKVFNVLTDKYIDRINCLPEKTFVLLCFAPKSWVMIVLMSSMGILLRNSSIPKLLLTTPYIMMTICLIAGGVQFVKNSHNR